VATLPAGIALMAGEASGLLDVWASSPNSATRSWEPVCLSLPLLQENAGSGHRDSADVTPSWSSLGTTDFFRKPDRSGTASRMIGSVRDSPGELLANAAEVTDLSGIRFRYRICGGVLPWTVLAQAR
jgi:hypothetical protein